MYAHTYTHTCVYIHADKNVLRCFIEEFGSLMRAPTTVDP